VTYKAFTLILCFFTCFWVKSQNSSIDNNPNILIKKVKKIINDPLRPSKAAFFSAVMPGLGQAYNKKYWKIPIVYGAIGTALYFYFENDKLYDSYRDAYKRRLAGFTDDEYFGTGVTPFISQEALIRAQRSLKRNKEMSILIAVGMYALNIIDANVDAHLLQYNMDENLTIEPFIDYNNPNYNTYFGLSLNIKF
tara:strand:+ start:6549 stop:7130 length:582 start_codon:yes stop_codon:yes gene_type:complete